MIEFTSLSGSLSPLPSPLSYLLSFDSSLILLDCGCHSSSPPSPSYLSSLRSIAPQVDFLLLSHPTLLSVGLYPWLRVKAGLRCPVYATLPTKEMGRLACEEWVEERGEEESKEGEEGEGGDEGWKLTTKEVREAFREVMEVKYGQPIHLGQSSQSSLSQTY
jgi:cleavage and polyadenylation specificity factor subunit 2